MVDSGGPQCVTGRSSLSPPTVAASPTPWYPKEPTVVGTTRNSARPAIPDSPDRGGQISINCLDTPRSLTSFQRSIVRCINSG